MSTITPIQQNPLAAETESPSRASIARQALTDNLDTFLTLLTTQLENQDPLQPMDTNQFVDQLTQFSELEQGVETNQTLTEIAQAVGAGDRQEGVALLGRTVEARGDILPLNPGGTQFAYEITQPAKNAEMRIFDQGGNLVAQFQVNGDIGRYNAAWDGTTLTGSIAGPGLYKAQVVSLDDPKNATLTGEILSGGTVQEVRFENGATKLVLDQGMIIDADDIQRVGV
ncbi:flagellar hook assembly protein FlgD [Parvularcula lutaonensis]|uniref:Basal-body rod modification protein FlgD n=1 Tax=Parvularcula lutaonensis TaxID=491923 RepID=A0ABV7MCU0_9PROT|nr:flagellar hook capping FlgD N-terminal domain-containing protein [Parvularcula lutaonensis]GGY50930.1 basal-body rod modification protein FlgD [Parvularcula lutaonensis]